MRTKGPRWLTKTKESPANSFKTPRRPRNGQRIELGEYVVADPLICHGKPTYKGTRIMVWQILEALAHGESVEHLVKAWGGQGSRPRNDSFGGRGATGRARAAASAFQPEVGRMNLLDENIRDDQRMLLRQWRIPFRQVGKEISNAGVHDDNLLPLLHQLKRPTLFTQDRGFFKRELCHRAYCLVLLEVTYIEVAAYIRRVLRHPALRTQAQRMGKVVRAHPGGVDYWQAGKVGRVSVKWSET